MKNVIFYFFLFIAFICSAEAQNLGDVNNSGSIDIVDALLIAQYSVGLNPGNFIQGVADVNCDNSINIVDALLTAQFYVGIISSFPCSVTNPPTTTPTGAPTNPPQSSGVIGWGSQNGGTTGGSGGATVTVSNYSDLENAVSGTDRRTVMVSGTITGSGMMQVGSNKTITSSGGNGTISGFGLTIKEQTNIIIQNLNFTNADDDSINVETYSKNIWIDHCSFSNGHDGLVDIKRGSSYITVSWNRFFNHGKTCLLGHSDDNADQDVGNLKVTYHHNFFDNTDTRHPRVRFGHVHVFNNYYVGNEYGVASTMNADVLVEGNYFRDVEDPVLSGYASSDPGDVVESNNVYDSCDNGPQTRGSVPSFPYSYSVDNPQNIPSIVSGGAGAGRM
jgi:pectate lyase